MKQLIWRLKIWMLSKKADSLHKIDGMQYFVIPYDDNGKTKLRLMNRKTHDLYNRWAEKAKQPQVSFPQLLKMALYKTTQGTLLKR